jgi:hypothetical protein
MTERNAFRLLVTGAFSVTILGIYLPPDMPLWLAVLIAALNAWAICFAKEMRHG